MIRKILGLLRRLQGSIDRMRTQRHAMQFAIPDLRQQEPLSTSYEAAADAKERLQAIQKSKPNGPISRIGIDKKDAHTYILTLGIGRTLTVAEADALRAAIGNAKTEISRITYGSFL